MSLRHSPLRNERGVAVYMVAVMLLLFMSFIGLAIDLGRGYIVRNALASAVDGAALAAARAIPAGQTAARNAANRIFQANFPSGFLGVTSVTNPPTVTFGTASDGSSLITVASNAILPTTFMRFAGATFNNLDVGSSGQATRRLVDMAFVIDRSGSLSSVFTQVKTASSNFLALFDTTYDRISLLSFANNTRVHSAIVQPGRGFSLGTLQSQIGALTADGATSTAEGLYQAWNQLRLVPTDNQSSLRAVVLFSDGAPNGFPALFPTVSINCPGNSPQGGNRLPPGVTGTMISSDVAPGNNADVEGLWDTYNTGSNVKHIWTPTQGLWSSPTNNVFTTINACIPWIPASSTHTPQQGTAVGIPTTFPLFQAGLAAQRGLINPVSGLWPNHVQNANNAARNLVEIIANQIRSDTTGLAPIHIFTLGLGNNLNIGTGAGAETGASILRRIANDPSSPQYNPNQPEGGYFFAGSVNDLASAYEAIRDQIIRISQ